MPSSLLKLLRQEYRQHRVARFAVWVLPYGAAVWLVERATGGASALLWFLFWGALIFAGGYYLGRLVGYVRQRLLWPVRRRLVVTYLFIAVVPILLILLLVGLGAYIINGQFAAFLVMLRLRGQFDELRQLNRVVAHEAHAISASSGDALLDRLQKFYVEELAQHSASYPGLQVTLRLGSKARAFALRSGRPLPPVTVPAWLTREEFAGTVLDEGRIELRALARAPTSAGELMVILSQPLTSELLDEVGAGVGPVGILTAGAENAAARPGGQSNLLVRTSEGLPVKVISLRSKSLSLPPPAVPLDLEVFGTAPLELTAWAEGAEQHPTAPVFVYVSSRIGALNKQILATLGEFSRIYVVALKVVGGVFLLIELLALIIGVRLTRSITTTVDKIHEATEHVKTGDFTYRVGIPAGDQLSALGEAFDNMTASVERLLRESQEKSRLDSEIAIAREVQSQLFPQSPPQVPGLELYGVCRPARSVSGDYYDFLHLGRKGIAIVLGDVSGKGISAALLMATIQASLHAQLDDGSLDSGSVGGPLISTAEVVARLNRQLFESTPLEQYATFFFAVYDPASRKLTYTNAGHLPPVLIRPGAVERLETGGTVVGLFSLVDYEQAQIELRPQDVLLAFTDGVTEPENSYGEQFGEARVIEAARRALHLTPEVLVQEITRSVSDWTGSSELPDDLTLLVARAVA